MTSDGENRDTKTGAIDMPSWVVTGASAGGPGSDTTAAHRAPASQESGGLNLAGAVAAALGFTTPGPTQGYGHTLPVVQSGVNQVPFSAGANVGSLAVSFPFPFATSPIVVATAAGDLGQIWAVGCSGIGVSGFTLNGRLANVVGGAVGYFFYWIAVGTPN